MAGLPVSWTVQCEALEQAVGRDPEALAIEIDPRVRIIHLGLRPLGATSQEVDSGAVLRRFIDAPAVHWGPIREWLLGPEAGELLQEISAGYTAEQLWSGDWQAQWSKPAWEAAHSLHQAITQKLQAPQEA